jgi:hypothetical protein
MFRNGPDVMHIGAASAIPILAANNPDAGFVGKCCERSALSCRKGAEKEEGRAEQASLGVWC